MNPTGDGSTIISSGPTRYPVLSFPAVIIPLVFALKVVDKATDKSTPLVPLKETSEEVSTSPETLKFLEFCNDVAVPAFPSRLPTKVVAVITPVE